MNTFKKAIQTVQLEQNNDGVVKIEISLNFWEKSDFSDREKGLYLCATPYKENGCYLPQMGRTLFLEEMKRFNLNKCHNFVVGEEPINKLLNAILNHNEWQQKN